MSFKQPLYDAYSNLRIFFWLSSESWNVTCPEEPLTEMKYFVKYPYHSIQKDKYVCMNTYERSSVGQAIVYDCK